MVFDDFVLRKIDRERRLKPRESERDTSLEDAFVKASKLLNHRDYSIQATDFFDLYGEENVRNDMQRVSAKQQAFDKTDTPQMKEAARASAVFEGLMIEQAELSNWLGDNVAVLKTSRFDDYFNGTDMVAEWLTPGQESQVLALAVDLTFGAHTAEKKFSAMRRRIDKGQLTSLKYFKTADGSFRGERSGIPSVVIGVSKPVLQEVSKLWMRNDKRALGTHPIQRVLVDEIYGQLHTIQSYAMGRGQTRVADAYRRSLNIIENLKKEKSRVPLGHMEGDKVYQEIMGQTRMVFST